MTTARPATRPQSRDRQAEPSAPPRRLARFSASAPKATRQRSWLSTTLALLVILFFWSLAYLAPGAPGERLSLDQLRGVVAQGVATEVTLRDQDSRFVVRVNAPVAG